MSGIPAVKEAFLKQILSEKGQQAIQSRGVYSDFLEENGFDDEATEQRSWTLEKQEAFDWLNDFASQAGQHCEEGYGSGTWNQETQEVEGSHEKWREITYEDLIEAGWIYINANGNDSFTQLGQEWLRDECQGETAKKYWQCFYLITGCDKGLPSNTYGEMQPDEVGPFSCSC